MTVFSSGSQLPPGAGRMRHWVFPARGDDVANQNASPTANVSARAFGGDFGGNSSSVTGTATITKQVQNRALCYRMQTLLATDAAILNFEIMNLLIEQQAAGFPGEPHFGAHSFQCIIAYDTPQAGAIPAGADLGLELTPGNVSSMNNGANRPGIMFGPVSDTQLGIRARFQFVAGYTVNDAKTFAQCNITNINKFNLYELRVIGATGAASAQLFAYVNGQRAFGPYSFSTAAALLPGYDSSGGGFFSLNWRVMNSQMQAPGYNLYINRAHSILAPTEQALIF